MRTTEMKYKMLVMDMDYTLLNKQKEVSERNKLAVQRAIEKGVHVVVATGRIYTSARVYGKLLGVNTPIIASNGAIIRIASFNDPVHFDKTIYRNNLKTEAILEMIRLSHRYDLFCHLFSEDTIFAEKLANISKRYTEWNQFLNEADRVKIRIVEDLAEAVTAEAGGFVKAVVVDEDSEKISGIRNDILKTGLVSASQSLRDNVEVMNKDVSKGNAVKFLVDMYGIRREEVIAIGDNENDVSMIEYAGLGIAMENADETLLKAADFVTGHYERDGVADAIERFIL